MRKNLEFLSGVIILFMMVAVLWKFIEPTPLIHVEYQTPPGQLPEADENQPPVVGIPEGPIPPSMPEGEIPDVPPTEPTPPTTNEPVACTMDAKMCPDGSYVGRVAPNCAFASCPNESSNEQIVCPAEARDADVCMAVVEPVCGLVQVQCVAAPCNPIPETFSNSCEACKNRNVVSYAAGACTPGNN